MDDACTPASSSRSSDACLWPSQSRHGGLAVVVNLRVTYAECRVKRRADEQQAGYISIERKRCQLVLSGTRQTEWTAQVELNIAVALEEPWFYARSCCWSGSHARRYGRLSWKCSVRHR